MGADDLVDHLKNCRKVDTVIAGDGDLTEVVDTMLAAGWTYGGVEYVEGKRVRYLLAPEDAPLIDNRISLNFGKPKIQNNQEEST